MSLSIFDAKLLEKILSEKYQSKESFSRNDVYNILGEMTKVEKYFPTGINRSGEKYKVFKWFVRYLFYRACSNLDNCIIIEGPKGSAKSSMAILLAREWCNILGWNFSTRKYMAYTNEQVVERIDNLGIFSPCIFDESVNFCCISGTSTIKTDQGDILIKDLVNKKSIKLLSLSNKLEYKSFRKCLQTRIDKVYELKTEDGKSIKCTKEHLFKTRNGFKKVSDLHINDKILTINKNNKIILSKIASIKYFGVEEVYDIIDVEDNNNYVANGFIVHNSSTDWAKAENRELIKKLAQVRTKHLFCILCWPLKITRVNRQYLDSFINYWIHMIKRGQGVIFIPDMNPASDTWQLKTFTKMGAFNEFSNSETIVKRLKKHPNYWTLIRVPKPSDKFYQKYLAVREKNVYNTVGALNNTSRQDVIRAIIIKSFIEFSQRDGSMSMKRLLPYFKREYGVDFKEAEFSAIVNDASLLLTKIVKDKVSIESFASENDWSSTHKSTSDDGDDDVE